MRIHIYLLCIDIDATDRWTRNEQQSSALIAESIATGSFKTYTTGWKAWLVFCELNHLEPPLTEIPVDFNKFDRLYTYEVAVVQAFCLYSFNERQVTASTIDNYLQGVSFMLQCRGRRTEFLMSFPVTRAKAALNLKCRLKKALSDRGSLPVSLSMLLEYLKGHPQGVLLHHATYTAAIVAFTLLLRISEYVVVAQSDHHLRVQDITFIINGRRVLSYQLIVEDWHRIDEVVIKVRSSKTDQDGSSTTFCFSNKAFIPENRNICVLLTKWSLRAKSQHDDPYFSCRVEQGLWKLNSKHVAYAIKYVAVLHQFNPERFSTHSLRYGGATTLAAAGLPDCWIQNYGRWKSLTFLQYIKMSRNIFDTIQNTVTSMDFNQFSHFDVAKLLA